MFDRLLLLKAGHILFQGSIPACLSLFESCGFPVPHYSNPADHILDVITPPMDLSVKETRSESKAREAEMRRKKDGKKGTESFDLEVAEADWDREHSQNRAFEDRLGSETPLGKALQAKRKKSFDHSLALEEDMKQFHSRTPSRAAHSAISSKSAPLSSVRREDQRNEAMLVSDTNSAPKRAKEERRVWMHDAH